MTADLLKVQSPDGISLAVERVGQGKPVLAVHGTTSTRGRWAPVLPALSTHFALYLMDRRGRGASGDAPGVHSMALEFADVAAVADAISQQTGSGITVVAHSYGAICALEAALLTPAISRLVVYEPPIPTEAAPESHDEGPVERLSALVASGDNSGALLYFYRSVIGMPETLIGRMTTRDDWPARTAVAPTLPREIMATRRYRFDAQRFAQLTIPTLVMVGAESPPRYQSSTALLAQTLPNNQTVSLAGQQHNAIDAAPDLFIRETLRFLAP
ncbi:MULTISPECIES: alpha/beta hydrolase [unclassified Chelatococcus]|uniref:alpha/beta fold hydrolase n=1 Tax=unclassified Chelatococcus TaxID=2638111 RepID=UPI001BCAACA1|nr:MULTISPECIES: alpha/beta hydrolase [unclassified Chelatococcus]CAH1657605.1 Alpha/beta hydrolase [Hyphomicrobiales bacterium]MBS7742287.1 alpha/beta hydrolase [Chelatococcus sp. HY11]MBX3542595.1 alpha/beta hydrolase [Chelatococcus sp.]MCO5075188.1 alpha/beta hydrolase [Chelatococcus sp.]CAH1689229.1 Alpha/beta hydrolase [Hyphomicrobiales bacterium]